jgi:hypothetical protein
MELRPKKFIGESIEVQFHKPPQLEKTPGPPDSFTWRGETFQVTEVLREWVDFRRRGRMARNMQPQHAATASRRGSWGVGEFHFRVRTDSGRIFDLYYDRAPKNADHRKGEWFLFQELSPEPDS